MKDITLKLQKLIDNDYFLRSMLEESIDIAYKKVSNDIFNPIKNIYDYLKFIDSCVDCYPWDILKDDKGLSLYDKINQGMGLLYFVNNQPLKVLFHMNFYYNCVMYYKPYYDWFTLFLKENERFLDSKESWNEECFLFAKANLDFNLNNDTYEDNSNWKCFNDFFYRKLSSPSKRPISQIDDDAVIISPADSAPFDVWNIDDKGYISTLDRDGEFKDFNIKTRLYRNVDELLDFSKFSSSFYNGKITHTMLDVNDYHRYHFPVSGEIIEIKLISGVPAPGGVIYWNKEKELYEQAFMNQLSWQAIETRGLIIVQTKDFGKVAIIPTGMCQVSSVNFREDLKVGSIIKKGDELGFFKFGGSNIVMIFEEKSNFYMTAEKDKHILMGEEYGRFKKD